MLIYAIGPIKNLQHIEHKLFNIVNSTRSPRIHTNINLLLSRLWETHMIAVVCGQLRWIWLLI